LYLVSAVLYKGVTWDLANVALNLSTWKITLAATKLVLYKACTSSQRAVLYKDLYLYSNDDGSPPSAHRPHPLLSSAHVRPHALAGFVAANVVR
jgi:hypothetical protein